MDIDERDVSINNKFNDISQINTFMDECNLEKGDKH